MTDNDRLNSLPEEELLKLDNQLCFALYVTSKEIIKKYKALLEPFDLTYTGYITMLALWEKDDVTVKALGERLYLDSGTLTPLLKKLENKGYIERRRSLEDERQVNILLTDAGRAMRDEAGQIPKGLICSLDFGDVSATELLGTLREIMPKLK